MQYYYIRATTMGYIELSLASFNNVNIEIYTVRVAVVAQVIDCLSFSNNCCLRYDTGVICYLFLFFFAINVYWVLGTAVVLYFCKTFLTWF